MTSLDHIYPFLFALLALMWTGFALADDAWSKTLAFLAEQLGS